MKTPTSATFLALVSRTTICSSGTLAGGEHIMLRACCMDTCALARGTSSGLTGRADLFEYQLCNKQLPPASLKSGAHLVQGIELVCARIAPPEAV